MKAFLGNEAPQHTAAMRMALYRLTGKEDWTREQCRAFYQSTLMLFVHNQEELDFILKVSGIYKGYESKKLLSDRRASLALSELCEDPLFEGWTEDNSDDKEREIIALAVSTMQRAINVGSHKVDLDTGEIVVVPAETASSAPLPSENENTKQPIYESSTEEMAEAQDVISEQEDASDLEADQAEAVTEQSADSRFENPECESFSDAGKPKDIKPVIIDEEPVVSPSNDLPRDSSSDENESENVNLAPMIISRVPPKTTKVVNYRKRFIAIVSTVTILLVVICLSVILSSVNENANIASTTVDVSIDDTDDEDLLSLEDVKREITENPVFGYMVAKGMVNYIPNPNSDAPKTIGELNPELLDFIRITDEAIELPNTASPHGFAIWYSQPNDSDSKLTLEYQNYAKKIYRVLDNFTVSYRKCTSQRNWVIKNNGSPSEATVIENENQVQSNWLTLSYVIMGGERTVIFGFSTYDMRFAYLGDSSTPEHLDDLMIES